MDSDTTRFSKASDVELPRGSMGLTRSYIRNSLYTEAKFLCQLEHCVHCQDKRVNFIYGDNGRILLLSYGAHGKNKWQNVVIMNVKNGEVNGSSYEHLLKQCFVTELHTKFAANPCGNARTSMHTHKHRQTTSKQELVRTSFKQI
jgi:hypothetical protein